MRRTLKRLATPFLAYLTTPPIQNVAIGDDEFETFLLTAQSTSKQDEQQQASPSPSSSSLINNNNNNNNARRRTVEGLFSGCTKFSINSHRRWTSSSDSHFGNTSSIADTGAGDRGTRDDVSSPSATSRASSPYGNIMTLLKQCTVMPATAMATARQQYPDKQQLGVEELRFAPTLQFCHALGLLTPWGLEQLIADVRADTFWFGQRRDIIVCCVINTWLKENRDWPRIRNPSKGFTSALVALTLQCAAQSGDLVFFQHVVDNFLMVESDSARALRSHYGVFHDAAAVGSGLEASDDEFPVHSRPAVEFALVIGAVGICKNLFQDRGRILASEGRHINNKRIAIDEAIVEAQARVSDLVHGMGKWISATSSNSSNSSKSLSSSVLNKKKGDDSTMLSDRVAHDPGLLFNAVYPVVSLHPSASDFVTFREVWRRFHCAAIARATTAGGGGGETAGIAARRIVLTKNPSVPIPGFVLMHLLRTCAHAECSCTCIAQEDETRASINNNSNSSSKNFQGRRATRNNTSPGSSSSQSLLATGLPLVAEQQLPSPREVCDTAIDYFRAFYSQHPSFQRRHHNHGTAASRKSDAAKNANDLPHFGSLIALVRVLAHFGDERVLPLIASDLLGFEAGKSEEQRMQDSPPLHPHLRDFLFKLFVTAATRSPRFFFLLSTRNSSKSAVDNNTNARTATWPASPAELEEQQQNESRQLLPQPDVDAQDGGTLLLFEQIIDADESRLNDCFGMTVEYLRRRVLMGLMFRKSNADNTSQSQRLDRPVPQWWDYFARYHLQQNQNATELVLTKIISCAENLLLSNDRGNSSDAGAMRNADDDDDNDVLLVKNDNILPSWSSLDAEANRGGLIDMLKQIADARAGSSAGPHLSSTEAERIAIGFSLLLTPEHLYVFLRSVEEGNQQPQAHQTRRKPVNGSQKMIPSVDIPPRALCVEAVAKMLCAFGVRCSDVADSVSESEESQPKEEFLRSISVRCPTTHLCKWIENKQQKTMKSNADGGREPINCISLVRRHCLKTIASSLRKAVTETPSRYVALAARSPEFQWVMHNAVSSSSSPSAGDRETAKKLLESVLKRRSQQQQQRDTASETTSNPPSLLFSGKAAAASRHSLFRRSIFRGARKSDDDYNNSNTQHSETPLWM